MFCYKEEGLVNGAKCTHSDRTEPVPGSALGGPVASQGQPESSAAPAGGSGDPVGTEQPDTTESTLILEGCGQRDHITTAQISLTILPFLHHLSTPKHIQSISKSCCSTPKDPSLPTSSPPPSSPKPPPASPDPAAPAPPLPLVTRWALAAHAHPARPWHRGRQRASWDGLALTWIGATGPSGPGAAHAAVYVTTEGGKQAVVRQGLCCVLFAMRTFVHLSARNLSER